ncbi:MAG: type II secretion system F family protein [Anaerolineae bacterium]
MGTFRYIATDVTARTIEGSIEAADERTVVGELRRGGYYPIRIEQHDPQESNSVLGRVRVFGRWPTRNDVLNFTQQFHSLMEAGLEVDRSLAILSELAESRRMRGIIRAILADVQGGRSLADSLAKHPKVFSRLYVHMVKAGEAGGVIELVLGRLAAFMESAKAIRDEILSALLYPSLVMTAGAGAVVVLLNFVIPRFATMFAETGDLLPPSTRLLLAISALTTDYWWVLIGVSGLAVVGVHGYTQTETGRGMWDRVKLRLPVFGRLIREREVARFARMLGTLLQSGVPVLIAMGIVTETVTNVALAQALPRVRDGVKRGEGIAGPLKACGIFPPLAVHMATVGEEAGRLEEMLLRVADVYDTHVKTSIKRLLSLVEPVMILSLGVIVGFIVVSMLLAIFSMSDLPL